MRVGLQVPNFTFPSGPAHLGHEVAQIAQRADQAGFASFWVMDHFFQIRGVGPAENDMLEGWTTLGFAAALTRAIKLGTMVTGVTYRYPGVLVKVATTLDVLSGGRAYLGIGAAWNEEEHRGLGVPYPSTSERFERLEETLQIALQMWSGEKGAQTPFNGAHYQLERTLNSPQSLQRPHPPILIGGVGEKKTLRLVAQYGDACNFFARLGDEELKRKLDVLRDHCQTLGRNYADIQKTSLDVMSFSRDGANDTLSPQAAIDRFGHLAELGFDEAIFSMPNPTDPAVFELLGSEIIPQVEKIAVAGR